MVGVQEIDTFPMWEMLTIEPTSGGCQSSVSVFTVDYDAPNCNGAPNVRPSLEPLVGYLNVTADATSIKRSGGKVSQQLT